MRSANTTSEYSSQMSFTMMVQSSIETFQSIDMCVVSLRSFIRRQKAVSKKAMEARNEE